MTTIVLVTSSCVSYTIAFIRVLHQIYFVANIKFSAIAQKECLDPSCNVCVRVKIELTIVLGSLT